MQHKVMLQLKKNFSCQLTTLSLIDFYPTQDLTVSSASDPLLLSHGTRAVKKSGPSFCLSINWHKIVQIPLECSI